MARRDETAEVAALLARAAASRTPSTARAWDYGWSIESYRRSPEAAMHSDARTAVSLSADGVASLEDAVRKFLRKQQIRELYDEADVWMLAASLVATVPLEDAARMSARLAVQLKRLLNPPASTVVFPIANLDPGTTPIQVGGLTLGHWDDPAFDAVRTEILPKLQQNDLQPWWVNDEQRSVVARYVGGEQMGRAVSAGERLFDDVVACALMFEPDLDAHQLFSLRGDSHRPGTRGLAIDRKHLIQLATVTPALERELGATIIAATRFGTRVTRRWFGEPPFPLGDLLGDGTRLGSVRVVVTTETDACRRLVVAARWHAKAYWSSNLDDAVLNLGVCFDALLTEAGPSPGRALADRFALLVDDPMARAARYRHFQNEIYPARSAVAHGARRSTIDITFVRRMAAEARATFTLIFDLIERANLRTEAEYNRVFENLKWGLPTTGPGA